MATHEIAIAVAAGRRLPPEGVAVRVLVPHLEKFSVPVTPEILKEAQRIAATMTLPKRAPLFVVVEGGEAPPTTPLAKRSRRKKSSITDPAEKRPPRRPTRTITGGSRGGSGVCTRCGGTTGECRCILNAARHIVRRAGDEDPVIENVIRELEESGQDSAESIGE